MPRTSAYAALSRLANIEAGAICSDASPDEAVRYVTEARREIANERLSGTRQQTAPEFPSSTAANTRAFLDIAFGSDT